MSLGNVGLIIASRTGSARLPGKALLPLAGLPMVVFLLRRLRGLKRAKTILATTQLRADDVLTDVVEAEGVPVFRGADADVVSRFVSAAAQFGFDTVVRVTADCPFVDAELADWCIAQAEELAPFDLATTKGRFPVGLDAEVYRAETMAALDRSDALTLSDREHLTSHMVNRPERYTVRQIVPPPAWAETTRHFTVDTREDYDAVQAFVAQLGGVSASIEQVVRAAE